VKPNIRKWKLNVLSYTSAVVLLGSLTYAVVENQMRQLASGEKAKVSGSILSRDGDLVRVRDKKSGELVVVNINDDTKIERKEHRILFARHADMIPWGPSPEAIDLAQPRDI
jgi:cell shape-determining protein MreC